jgi:hypothetical protein
MKRTPLSILACLTLATYPISLPAAQTPQVSLIDIRPLHAWSGAPVGNVAITTANGKHLQLSKSATVQQPKVTRSGLVGWIDCSKPSEPAALNVVKGVPIGSHLILRKPDGSLITITSAKPIIEEWGFDPDGIHIVLKSRALHGPAVIERFSIQNGSKAGACLAYVSTAPTWAKPYLEQ